jgi:acetyl-CoA C-acetyltransferase
MPLDPRTPLLVGAATACQREDDPEKALEAVALMGRALERAGEDAGAPSLLARADAIRVPAGLWSYRDPGRWLAERLGAPEARTTLAQVGVLQTTLLASAARDIAEGRADVVLVAGGEARYRDQCALRAGVTTSVSEQPEGARPDERLVPEGEIVSVHEIRAGLGAPVSQFALLENALRAADGTSVEAHRDAVAELWSAQSRIAAGNPDAWSPEPLDPKTIRDPVDGNRMLAFPYTKRHASQWNVDQAAGLVFCSLETARAAGIPRERWIFPHAVAESNHMRVLSERPELHRSPGFARAGERALDRAGIGLDEVAHLELYSCFPSAVRIQLRELGIAPDRAVTLTGGMAFAGGPFNNFVLQGLVRMAQVLRADPGSRGLLTAVSGIVNKQGVSLWSSEPGPGPFVWDDVSDDVDRVVARVELADEGRGEARVASYTVVHAGEGRIVVLLCDLADGRRAFATSPDPELADRASTEEMLGRAVRLSEDGPVLTA